MRAPAFQWYAAEYLADERVAQLTLESEAVYVRLLSYCWREGTIPANPVQCVPLCKYADVKVIKPALTLFMRAPGQPGRLIHKRLEEERAKQQAFKDKQVINGKLGGRPRKASDNPDESQPKGLGYSGLTQTEPKKRSSTSSSTSTSFSSAKETTSNEVDAATAAASAPEKKIAAEALQPESQPAAASHTGGAADVPTRKPASRCAYDPADIHPGLVLPFDTDEFRALWAGYRQYREEQKLPRLNGGMQEQEALRHLRNLAPDVPAAAAIISQTVRNGWKTLFKLDEPRPQHHAQNGASGYGQRPAPAVHANPFGIASPQSLAIAGALASGGHRDYSDLI